MLTGICLMIWVLIPRYCRKLHYRLEEEGITITRGLFFARMIRLPRRNLFIRVFIGRRFTGWQGYTELHFGAQGCICYCPG